MVGKNTFLENIETLKAIFQQRQLLFRCLDKCAVEILPEML